MKHLITMREWDKASILSLLNDVERMEKNSYHEALKGKIIATCFFEPSTRTRLSFETAAKKLGAATIGFSEGQSTSMKKGESLSDTMRVISHYADGIVIRHSLEGAARLAASVSAVPVINGGDGANQHPTQALIDLAAIYRTQGRLDNIHLGIAGDLRYGRCVRSLIHACAPFNMRFYLIARRGDELPRDLIDYLRNREILFSFHESLEEVLPKLDILYMTRMQQERRESIHFASEALLTLKASMLEKVKDHLRILHPLPRIEEIAADVDKTPYAAYFAQAELGVPVRMALLVKLLLKGGV